MNNLRQVIDNYIQATGGNIYTLCAKYGLSHPTVYLALKGNYVPKTLKTKLAFKKLFEEYG